MTSPFYPTLTRVQDQSSAVKAMVESMGGVSAVLEDEAKMQEVVESLSVGHSMTLGLVHKL